VALAAPVLAMLLAGGARPATAPAFGPPHDVVNVSGDVGALTELETGDLNADGLVDVVVTRLRFRPRTTLFQSASSSLTVMEALPPARRSSTARRRGHSTAARS